MKLCKLRVVDCVNLPNCRAVLIAHVSRFAVPSHGGRLYYEFLGAYADRPYLLYVRDLRGLCYWLDSRNVQTLIPLN